MRRVLSLIPWIFLPLSISPLLVWAVLGFSSRYLADDYSTSSILLKNGFWAAQAFWYQSWSGRYAFTFLISLVELIGVRVVPWLPAAALTGWFLALFWALKQIFSALSLPVEKKWIGVLAAAIIFGVVKSLPGYTEVIFWQTGILTYQISNIFFALCLGLFLKRFFSQPGLPAATPREYFTAFFIAFIIGGFSETGIVVQVAVLTLALLYFASFYKSHHRNDILRILSAAYVASWMAFLIIAKSPGNLGRTSRMAGITVEALGRAMLAAIMDVPVFLAGWVSNNTALVIGLLLTGIVVGFFTLRSLENDKIWQRSHLILGFSLLALAASSLSAGFFPAFVVWGTRPADRAVFVPLFIFIWVFVLFGFFLGRFLSSYPGKLRPYFQALLLLVLALSMLWVQVRAALAATQMLPAVQKYARLWDERDAFLRSAGAQNKDDIVLPSLRHQPGLQNIRDTIWITGELLEDPRNWINQMAASYYGVKSISGK